MGQVELETFYYEPILKEKVKENLIATQSEDVHQAIMNVAYDLYKEHLDSLNKESEGQNREHRWVYSDLCQFTKENLGSLAEFAVLIGKYNQQVENGGHYQYWYNEYGSMGGQYRDLYLHMNLIDYFTIFKDELSSLYKEDQLLEINETVEKALSIMKDLPESLYWVTKVEYKGFDCYGDVSYYDPDTDCRNLSEESRRRLEYLDDHYYRINRALMDVLSLYFYNYLNQE